MLQMLAMVVDPLGRSNPGSQLYHFVGGFMDEPTFGECHPECLFPGVVALGDCSGITATGLRPRMADDGISLADHDNLPSKQDQ